MSKIHDLIHERFLLVSLFLFILSSTIAYALAPDTNIMIDIVIDIFGALMGVISIFLIFNVVKSFKGSLREGFNYIIYGIAFQVLALIEHTLMDFEISLIPVGIDTHHILMVIGIAFFTIAVFKLRNMLAELNKKS